MSLEDFTIIPLPQSIIPGAGKFTIDAETRISAAPEAHAVAETLAALLRPATGYALPIEDGSTSDANSIGFTTAEADANLGDEGYMLSITPENVTIRANTAAGMFYGVQSLRQLLPADIEHGSTIEGVAWSVPAGAITDVPRFQWRGLHLDVGRHMFPVAFIKKFIDLMALHKLNTFHWHLTEDQGWRIEIKRYLRLTEVGAFRDASPLPHDRKTLDGKPYGGYYTQEEVREVVAYAQARFINVVPEIEMPGHSKAVLAAYPNLGCAGEGYKVRQFWGIDEDVLCAGNEDVYAFMEDVLSEVLALFPSKFIHVGGDECPKVRWETCPKCQAKIEQEGLEDEHALQSYFIQRIEKWLNDQGRRLIGWDEILEGGLAPNATVMSWRGSQGGIDAATAGHDVVMTPNTHVYFDYYQSEDTENEPPAIGGYLPLENVYQFEPTAGIPEHQHPHVLGGQANMWTEYVSTSEGVEYMVYPRGAALAETVWSPPTNRDYADFTRRLRVHLARLDVLGVNYRQPFEQA